MKRRPTGFREKGDEFELLPPDPLPSGNSPVVEHLRASRAVDIIRHLGPVPGGPSRPESPNRIEHNRVEPSIRTVDMIDRALREAEPSGKSDAFLDPLGGLALTLDCVSKLAQRFKVGVALFVG